MSRIVTIETLKENYNDVDLWPELILTPEIIRFVQGAMQHARDETLEVCADIIVTHSDRILSLKYSKLLEIK